MKIFHRFFKSTGYLLLIWSVVMLTMQVIAGGGQSKVIDNMPIPYSEEDKLHQKLLIYVYKGDIETFKETLEAYLDEIKSEKKICTSDANKLLKESLNKVLDLEYLNLQGSIPLFAYCNDLEVEKANINLLFLAVCKNHIEIVKFLLVILDDVKCIHEGINFIILRKGNGLSQALNQKIGIDQDLILLSSWAAAILRGHNEVARILMQDCLKYNEMSVGHQGLFISLLARNDEMIQYFLKIIPQLNTKFYFCEKQFFVLNILYATHPKLHTLLSDVEAMVYGADSKLGEMVNYAMKMITPSDTESKHMCGKHYNMKTNLLYVAARLGFSNCYDVLCKIMMNMHGIKKDDLLSSSEKSTLMPSSEGEGCFQGIIISFKDGFKDNVCVVPNCETCETILHQMRLAMKVFTPFIGAVIGGHKDIVCRYIKNGLDHQQREYAICFSIIHGHTDIFKMLSEKLNAHQLNHLCKLHFCSTTHGCNSIKLAWQFKRSDVISYIFEKYGKDDDFLTMSSLQSDLYGPYQYIAGYVPRKNKSDGEHVLLNSCFFCHGSDVWHIVEMLIIACKDAYGTSGNLVINMKQLLNKYYPIGHGIDRYNFLPVDEKMDNIGYYIPLNILEAEVTLLFAAVLARNRTLIKFLLCRDVDIQKGMLINSIKFHQKISKIYFSLNKIFDENSDLNFKYARLLKHRGVFCEAFLCEKSLQENIIEGLKGILMQSVDSDTCFDDSILINFLDSFSAKNKSITLVNLKDISKRCTPLAAAVKSCQKDDKDIVHTLLQCNVVEGNDNALKMALMMTIFLNKAFLFKILLQQNDDLVEKQVIGYWGLGIGTNFYTLIMTALALGQKKCVEHLLEYSIDLQVKSCIPNYNYWKIVLSPKETALLMIVAGGALLPVECGTESHKQAAIQCIQKCDVTAAELTMGRLSIPLSMLVNKIKTVEL